MKLKFRILFILAQFISFCFAQKSMMLKTHYTPQTNYNQTITQVNHSTLTYIGKPDFLENIKANGIENPTISADSSVINMVMRTGKQQKDQTFKVELEYVSSERSDGEKYIPDGTIIFGNATNSKMELDSVYSPYLDENLKKVVLQTIKSMFSQLKYPEKTMKIGDIFTQEMPLSIPIADKTLNMVISSMYKLVTIENNMAFFEIIQNYTMVTNILEEPISASGSGKGKFKYSLDYNYIIYYEMESDMFFRIISDDYEINLKQGSRYVQECTITKK